MSNSVIVLNLVVYDYDVAIKFYRDILGDFDLVANIHMAKSCLVRLRHSDQKIGFEIRVLKKNAEDYDIAFPSGGDGIVRLTLPTTDCDGKFARLKAYGVPMDREIKDLPWGRSFRFRDPFGNLLGYFQPIE